MDSNGPENDVRCRDPQHRVVAFPFCRCLVLFLLVLLGLTGLAVPSAALEPSSHRWEVWQTRLDGSLRDTPSSLRLPPRTRASTRALWSLRTRASVHRIEGADAFWPEDDGLAAGGRLTLAQEPHLSLRLSDSWFAQAAVLWSVTDEIRPQTRLQTLTLIREGERHRLALGREPIRWGPGLQGSLLLGRSAPPRWQLSWQTRRALRAPIFRKTTWSGGAFLAYLDDEDRVFPRPLLFGHRLSWQPTRWLELTGTRTILFGGRRGRTRGLTLRGIWEILTVQNENLVGPRPPSDSDQRASFEARLQLPLSFGNWAGAEVYYEYGGEDVNDPPLPSAVAHHYGAVTRFWEHTVVVDFVETVTGRNRWYGHTLYQTGYFHEGFPLGLPMGADAEGLALAVWSPPGDASWRVLRREETHGFHSGVREVRVTWEVSGRLRFGDWLAEATLARTRQIGPARELRAPAFPRDRLELRLEKHLGPVR